MWDIPLKLFLINLGQWLMRRRRLKIFLFLSSGGYFSAEQDRLSNFGRGHYEDHLCRII